MNVYEDIFPGNEAVFNRLLDAFEGEGVTALTGAGTSMPDLPGWGALVVQLIEDAEADGKIETVVASALKCDSDYLYVIDEIYGAAGEAQTKAKVAKLFGALASPTEAHKLLAQTNFSRIMTLNYDHGIEIAYAQSLSRHVSSIVATQTTEVDEWLRQTTSDISPILHWHGRSADAQSIVLSGGDYSGFYDSNSNYREALRNIFNTKQMLMVGFGFSDPFIERELGAIMRPFPKSTRHFAIIGMPEDSQTTMERRKYETKYKLETIFYPIKKTQKGGHDHSGLLPLLLKLRDQKPRSDSTVPSTPNQQIVSKFQSVSYKSNLFTFGDRQIYCQPNIWAVSIAGVAIPEYRAELNSIVNSSHNCSVEAPNEYGLTNLGRKIAWDIELTGRDVIFRDAHGFPKHKKALLQDQDFSNRPKESLFTVIIDNFSAIDHQRCVRELLSTFANARVIVLQRSNYSGVLDDSLTELQFHAYQLRSLSRSDVRQVVNILAQNNNDDVISTVVDKVYTDLLQLCIPLTPSNVIMYASVLCKDGTFSPVSRLHIVEKFTSEALVRASDAYADTFNAMNKLDLISEFCYGLFSNDKTDFVTLEWSNFCQKYKSENLVEFNHIEILGDLINGKIVVQEGQIISFRYRMFFSYFVGRHISAHPDLLSMCLKNNQHLELDGLVEVLCGTLHDGSEVLNDLTVKLTMMLDDFYGEYPISGLDFHKNAKWELTHKEDDLWESVSDRLASGPASTQELDELKSSIHAERRTVDQKVSIIKFIASKESVVTTAVHLNTALESVKQANANSKKAATTAVIGSHILAYEVASVFVPLIAERKYVSWGGFTYINLIEDIAGEDEDLEASRARMRNLVTYALPASMARSATDTSGSRKHGQVFKALMDQGRTLTPIHRFILFCLLIKSKPTGWLTAAMKVVANTSRDDLYLRHMLYASMRQFKHEINTESERRDLKSLVVAIRLRREAKVKAPSQTEINRSIKILDGTDFWETEVRLEDASQDPDGNT